MIDIQDIIDKYKTGHRYFINLDFDKGEKLTGQLLIDAIFENCYFSVDFSNTDFSNSKFINCNLKCSVFKNCKLINTTFENCLLECADFKDIINDSMTFANCSCYGQTVQLDKETNELIVKKDSLVKELYDNVPEFIEMIDHTEDELPYVIYGQLSLKLYDDITQSDNVSDFVKKCFKYFNKLGNRNNHEIDKLLVVGIYEGLYANKRCNDLSRQFLTGRNKEVYEYWMINGNIRAEN